MHYLAINTIAGEPTLQLTCDAGPDADCRKRPADDQGSWSYGDPDLTGTQECWAIDFAADCGWEDGVACDPNAAFPKIPVEVWFDEGVKIRPASTAEVATVEQLAAYRLGAVFTDRHGDVWMLDSHAGASVETMLISPETARMTATRVLKKYGPLTLRWAPE